jgi:pilus assembly protein FimV
MIEKLFEILNLQETWESVVLQLQTMFDPENSAVLGAINFLIDKIAENPLASIITVAALIGLPYTLFKAKQSDTEAKERLDELMDEMQDFEFEKPLIDLQEKFKDSSFDDSPVINYDQDILELNFDKVESAFGNEETPVIQDLESTSFVKQITLDQELTDDFLSSGSIDPVSIDPISIDPISDSNEESLDLSSLSEDFFDAKEITPPVKPDVVEKEPATLFTEDLELSNEEQEFLELAPIEEEYSSTLETSLPVDSIIELEEPAKEVIVHEETTLEREETVSEQEETAQDETIIEKEEAAIPVADDLQARMEQTLQKLKMKYASPGKEDKGAKDAQETGQEQVPVAINSAKKPASPKEPNADDSDTDTSDSSKGSTPADSQVAMQGNSLKKSPVITHLDSFKKNFEKQLDMNEEELKKKSTDIRQDQNAFFKTVQKSVEQTHLKEKTTTDKEYQQSLESFLFLKNQDKSE